MITSGRNSVNVSRIALLEQLKKNLAIHKTDYIEALAGYKVKLIADLKATLTKVESSTPEQVLNVSAVAFSRPISHEDDYNEIIDMMEVSVDEVINLDASSFKSYFKNEWSWSGGFNTQATMYKSAAMGASLN